MLKSLVFFASAALTLATPVPFTSCGQGHATITTLDANPYPPVKGQDVVRPTPPLMSSALTDDVSLT